MRRVLLRDGRDRITAVPYGTTFWVQVSQRLDGFVLVRDFHQSCQREAHVRILRFERRVVVIDESEVVEDSLW